MQTTAEPSVGAASINKPYCGVTRNTLRARRILSPNNGSPRRTGVSVG